MLSSKTFTLIVLALLPSKSTHRLLLELRTIWMECSSQVHEIDLPTCIEGLLCIDCKYCFVLGFLGGANHRKRCWFASEFSFEDRTRSFNDQENANVLQSKWAQPQQNIQVSDFVTRQRKGRGRTFLHQNCTFHLNFFFFIQVTLPLPFLNRQDQSAVLFYRSSSKMTPLFIYCSYSKHLQSHIYTDFSQSIFLSTFSSRIEPAKGDFVKRVVNQFLFPLSCIL